jgi:serine/threonine-protein kinase
MTGIRYGKGVRRAMDLAKAEAFRAGSDTIEPVHVLLGLCEACEEPKILPGPDAGAGPDADPGAGAGEDPHREVREIRLGFERVGLDLAAFRRRLRSEVGTGAGGALRSLLRSRGPAAQEAFDRASALAADNGERILELPHLLHGLMSVPSPPGVRTAAAMGVPNLNLVLLRPRDTKVDPAAPRPPDFRAVLTLIGGPEAGREFAFTERSVRVIGVADHCSVRIPEVPEYPGVAPHHCLLDIDPPAVRVRDLGSTHGTSVNGEVLVGRPAEPGVPGPTPREVKDGDEIRLGGVTLGIRIEARERCRSCGGPLPDDAAQGGHPPGGSSCESCLTAQAATPQEAPAARGNSAAREASSARPAARAKGCVVCGDRLPRRHPFQPHGEELCPACASDPSRIRKHLPGPAGDGSGKPARFGAYTLERELGRGGMGIVYLGRDGQTEELVALKVMRPQTMPTTSAKALFHREIAALQILRHPHLVRLTDHGDWHGVDFFAMDHCEGGDVRSLVRRRGGRLPFYQAVGIIAQVLTGLQFAHQAKFRTSTATSRLVAVQGLVHRDLSPANIFLDCGIARLGDFGLAKAFDIAGHSGLTRSGSTAGNVHYVCRQQALDYRNAKPEVDVWAAAACLYFMLTGQSPREFSSRPDPWQDVVDSPAVPILRREPTIPERLARVVDHALVEKPRLGFSTADELRLALLEAVR